MKVTPKHYTFSCSPITCIVYIHTQISARSNCVFEVVSQEPVTRGDLLDSSDPDMDSLPLLRLKGEMLQFRKQQSIVFLCSPV